MSLQILHLVSILLMANIFEWCAYFVLIYILSLMKTLKELGEMRYAYRKKVRLQKYNNIESRMAFSKINFRKVYILRSAAVMNPGKLLILPKDHIHLYQYISHLSYINIFALLICAYHGKIMEKFGSFTYFSPRLDFMSPRLRLTPLPGVGAVPRFIEILKADTTISYPYHLDFFNLLI